MFGQPKSVGYNGAFLLETRAKCVKLNERSMFSYVSNLWTRLNLRGVQNNVSSDKSWSFLSDPIAGAPQKSGPMKSEWPSARPHQDPKSQTGAEPVDTFESTSNQCQFTRSFHPSAPKLQLQQ